MLANEDKKQILTSFLETIEGISDKNYQRRIWIRGEGPEVDDFTETVCHFFEEVDDILEKHKDFGIVKEQYEILKVLKNHFSNFIKGPRTDYLPEEFIETPEWTKITEIAKQILEAFEYKKINEIILFFEDRYIFLTSSPT